MLPALSPTTGTGVNPKSISAVYMYSSYAKNADGNRLAHRLVDAVVSAGGYGRLWIGTKRVF